MGNAVNAVDLSIPLSTFLATPVGNGTWADVLRAAKQDPPGQLADALDIAEHPGELLFNAYDDLLARAYQALHRVHKTWEAADATARDALGSTNGLRVDDTCFVIETGDFWRCVSVDSPSASTWAPLTTVAGLVDLREFGAVGQGADDTAAWNAAILAAATRGAPLFVPPGTYNVRTDYQTGGSIRVVTNTRINMAPGAIVQAIPSSAGDHAIFYLRSAHNVVITGGHVRGDRGMHTDSDGVNAGHGFRISACSHVTIADMRIEDTWGDGIYVRNGLLGDGDESVLSTQVTISRVTTDNCRRTGLAAVGVDGMLVENCWFVGSNGANPFAGSNAEPNIDGYTRNIVYLRCHAYGNEGAGFQTSGVNVAYIDCEGYGNTTNGFRILNTSGGRARHVSLVRVDAHTNDDYGIVAEDAIGLSIFQSETHDNGVAGFRCRAMDHDSLPNLQLRGLVARNNATLGVIVEDAPRALLEGVVAEDNGEQGIYAINSPGIRWIGCTALANGGHNLQIDTGCDLFRVSAVHSEGAASSGLRVDSPNGSVTGSSFIGNGAQGNIINGARCLVLGNHYGTNGQLADNTYDHIEVLAGNCVVDYNIGLPIAALPDPRTRYGVRLGTDASSTFVGRGNRFAGTVVQTYSDASLTGGQILMAFLATVNLGSISAGAWGTAVSVAATGVRPGDAVTASPTDTFPTDQLIVDVRVTTANQIRVNAYNTTGSSVDPPPVSFRFLVSR